MEFFNRILAVVVQYIAAMGYWGVGIGMAIESACIPLPSEVILPLGGYLAYRGDITFWGAVMAGTIGGTTGSIIAYAIGYFGGRPLLEKYGRYMFIKQKELELADRWFQRHGEATVFWTRLMPVVRTFISLPAGIARMNFLRFVIYTFLGSLPWSILPVYLGYKMGENWPLIRQWFHKLDYVIIAALVVLVAWFFYRRRRGMI
ncbi:MAG: hypothetical protein PWQ91_284 [Eubacteriales bacterium]|nr:hypothetical protein [Eubacteriales bacterium]